MGEEERRREKWNKLGWTDTKYIPATSSPFLFSFHPTLSKHTISTGSQRIFLFLFFIIMNKLHVYPMGFKSTTSPSNWIIAHWQIYKLSNNKRCNQINWMYKKKHRYQLPTEDFKGQRAIKSKKKKQQKNQVLSLPPSWVKTTNCLLIPIFHAYLY